MILPSLIVTPSTDQPWYRPPGWPSTTVSTDTSSCMDCLFLLHLERNQINGKSRLFHGNISLHYDDYFTDSRIDTSRSFGWDQVLPLTRLQQVTRDSGSKPFYLSLSLSSHLFSNGSILIPSVCRTKREEKCLCNAKKPKSLRDPNPRTFRFDTRIKTVCPANAKELNCCRC